MELRVPRGVHLQASRALAHSPLGLTLSAQVQPGRKRASALVLRYRAAAQWSLPVTCGRHFCLGTTADFPDLLFQATGSSQTAHNFTRKILEIWAKCSIPLQGRRQRTGDRWGMPFRCPASSTSGVSRSLQCGGTSTLSGKQTTEHNPSLHCQCLASGHLEWH